MTPLSPILFVTAVKGALGAAVDATRSETCAMQFVEQMGMVSHRVEPYRSTSWPLLGVRTVKELRHRAMAEGMLRLVPRVGDLAIPAERYGLPVAVVLQVLEYGVGPVGRSIKCQVVFATPGAHGSEVQTMDVWYAPGRGDVFVRWYQLAPRPFPLAQEAA